MQPLLLAWTLFAVVTVALAAQTWVQRRRRQRWRVELDEQQTRSAGDLRAVTESNARQVDAIVAAHAHDLQTAEDGTRDALAAVEDARAFAATGMKWEAASHKLIADACESLRIDAVLATNVVFIPQDAPADSPFLAQIDHVLVTDASVLVIESKWWRGVVFDGVRPSSIHASFGAFLDDSELVAPFSLQVVADSDERVRVRRHAAVHAPAPQARQQARRLSGLIRKELGRGLLVRSCVFYAHPEVTLHASPRDTGAKSISTDIIGRSRLREVIKRTSSSDGQSSDLPARLTPLLVSLGAHVVGFGRYESLPTVSP
jgi:hypothetical protein